MNQHENPPGLEMRTWTVWHDLESTRAGGTQPSHQGVVLRLLQSCDGALAASSATSSVADQRSIASRRGSRRTTPHLAARH